jgi:hypothetical protein
VEAKGGGFLTRLGSVLGLAALGLAGLAACAGAPAPSASSPAAPATVAPAPAEPGQRLDQLGFSHGPAARLYLPKGASVTYAYDAEKTLIVLGPADQGPAVAAYLADTLPGLGWTVTAAAADALRFDDGTWQGSFVIGQTEWGLTVRAE